MKKLINLIALVMLVSTNVLTPFSYAQVEIPEVIPENEVGNVEEIGETPEKDNEITGEIPNSLGEVEGEGSLPLVREVVNETSPAKQGENLEGLKEEVEDSLDDIETPMADEIENVDTESNEVAQPLEEISENEIQDEDLQLDEVEDDFLLQKEDETMIMQVQPGTTATLLPGQQFNQTIKRLAGNSSATNYTSDSTIKQIVYTGNMPSGVTTTGISISDSEKEVIARYDSGIIYYTTQAETIYLNPHSSYMLYGMKGLTGLDLSGWDTSKVIDMSYMFSQCTNLKSLDLNHFDTSNVTNMSSMFSNCGNLMNLNLSRWNTSNVTSMYMMFSDSNKLEELNLSGWNTSKVLNMDRMFLGCKSLNSLNLANFDTTNVTNMYQMFSNCSNLETIYVSTGFDVMNLTDLSSYYNMFYNDIKLLGGNGTNFDDAKIDKTYAKADKPGQKGYFTDADAIMVKFMIGGKEYKVQSVELGKKVIKPENPYRTGANFEKWVDKNGEEYDFDTEIDRYTELYAKFSSGGDAILLPGKEFNVTIKRLAGQSDANLGSINYSIKGILYTGDVPSGVTTGLISLPYSEYPVYAYFTGGIIYYVSQAENLYMNSDSSYMFNELRGLTSLDLSNFNTSIVKNMNSMFYYCDGLRNLNLSSFDTSNVTNMSKMFLGCINLTRLNLSSFDTSNVTDMNRMFYNCQGLQTIYISTLFDVMDVTNFSYMFYMNTKLVGGNGTRYDLDNMEMDKTYAKADKPGQKGYFTDADAIMVKFMIGGKEYKVQSVELGKKVIKPENPYRTGANFEKWVDKNGEEYDFDTEIDRYTELYAKFSSGGDAILLPGEKFNETIKQLAGGYSAYSSNSNIKKVVRADSVLEGVATRIISSPYSENEILVWFTGGVLYYTTQAEIIYMNPDSRYMFQYFYGLTGLDLSDWNASNVISMWGMFYDSQNLISLDVGSRDTSNVINMSYMFYNCQNLVSPNISNWDTSNVISMSSMFYNCQNLVSPNISNWDTSNVINMSSMFYNCQNLVSPNISSRDTSSVQTMSDMFYGCSSLTGLDLSNFDTSKVTSVYDMFYGCSRLESLNLNGWDFRSIGSSRLFEKLLRNSSSLKIINMENTNHVGSMEYIFNGAYNVEEINLYGAKTSNVEWMREMFKNASNLKYLNLDGWDTSKVRNMDQMFNGCSSLTSLDLSSFDTNKVEGMWGMFQDMKNLKTIYTSDKFVIIDGGASHPYMFDNDINLIGGNGTKFDSGYTDKTYAKIDKVGQTGYFTDKNAINVKFINTLDGTETTSTFAKGQKLTPPYVDKYHVVGGYLDEEMTQAIDLNKGVDSYSVIYIKYERNGSSGGGGGGGSSKKTDEDTHGSAEDSQKNTQDDKNTENVIQSETKGSEESSNTPMDSSDKSSEGQEILSPSDSSFTKEQKDAYTFAKENGITTKDTIQSAQMNGKLTRIAMAKMLSQYAINVLGQIPDTSKTIKFKDVSNKKDADYDNGVTLAYQLGIMGQNMPNNKFRPNDEVSRAEFATALSRLLYQTTDGEYKSTSKYYTPHMAKLYNEGIINNTDPSMKERRGYVMIMLMRSAEK